MKLNDEQIAEIRKTVEQSGIGIQTLRDDLVDHLCCVAESKIETGKKFETALSEALHELAPDGLDEIQRETIYLLNSNKTIFMKKLMYLVGLLSTMAFVSGWACGLLQLPGHRELSIYGFFAFVFIFLPLLTIDYYKIRIQRAVSDKFKLILGLMSGVIIAFATIFKMMHWPGASELLIAGTVIFVFGFLPFQFFTMYKKSVS